MVWQASDVYEYTNRNSHQTNPEIRAENSRKTKEALGGLVTTYGVGVVGSRVVTGAIRFFRGPAQEEVNFLFRGTSEGFNGSNASQQLGVTPTSSDPVVATIFALNSKNYGKGILQIALPQDLKGVQYTGNVLQSLEKEIGVGMAPAQFTLKASTTITADQAVGILKNMGIKLPTTVKLENLSEVIRNTPRLTPNQIQEFYKQARLIKSP